MIIYYQDTLDCRMAANLVYHNRDRFISDTSEGVRVLPYRYSNEDILDIVNENEVTIVLGVGFFFDDKDSRDRLQYIIDCSKEVIWIDYHINTVDVVMNYIDEVRVHYNPTRSVSAIVHYDILGKEENYAIDLMNAFELGNFDDKLPYGFSPTRFACYLSSLYSRPDDDMWQSVYNAMPNEIGDFIDDGDIILNFLKQHNIRKIESSRMIDFEGTTMTLINVDYRMIAPEIGFTYNSPILTWVYEDGVYKYALFAGRTDIDCVAKTSKFNGFGRKNFVHFFSKEFILNEKI